MSVVHVCFGCQRPIRSRQPHIHVGLDEWGQRNGLSPLGIDLGVVFCQPCTEKSDHGWQLEVHE